jgi:hypothetical protein
MPTPYMNLDLPTVNVTSGPEWASKLNIAFEALDAHDHSDGKGARVSPAGMNINGDLEFNDNNAVELKSARYNNQGAALAGINDIRCVYVSGNDLYYNNGTGTAVQITAGAGLNAASIGGIGGDYASSSASVSYSNANKTFSFTQSANTAAHLDAGNVIIREPTASANGITLKSPISLGSAYNFIFPTGLPSSGQTKILSIDSSGQVGALYDSDNSTIEVSSNELRVKDGGITASKMASNAVATATIQDGAVTHAKRGAVPYSVSSSSGNYSRTSGAEADITNLSVSFTSIGRPVRIQFIGDTTNPSFLSSIGISRGTSGTAEAYIYIYRDSTVIAEFPLALTAGSSSPSYIIPASSISHTDFPAAGTYTFKARCESDGLGTTLNVTSVKLMVYEL